MGRPRAGSVYQRASDGLYVCAFYTAGSDERQYAYASTRAAAREKARERGGQLGLDMPAAEAPASSWALEDWIEWWLERLVVARRRRKPRTVDAYRERARLHINPAIGRIRLADLRPTHIDVALSRIADKGLGGATVNAVRTVLVAALEDAQRRELVERNAARVVEGMPAAHGERSWLRPAEARRLLDVATADRLYALYAVALAVGLRRGEVVGLSWSEIDLDAGELAVEWQTQRVAGCGLVRERPKSRRSRRRVWLPPVCAEALRHHREVQDLERTLAADRWRDTGLVFVKPNGTGYAPETVLRQFQALCRRAGLGHRTLHELRHTAASLLLAQHVDVRVVQEILGHESLEVTGGYAHVASDLHIDAAARMNKLLTDE